MKHSLIIIFILIASSFHVFGNEIRDIINDPAISRRCKALLSERTEKIKIQQRLNSLVLRNQKLQKMSKSQQKSVNSRLELNLVQLKNNLRLTRMRLKSMEENIVRKGCPGISL